MKEIVRKKPRNIKPDQEPGISACYYRVYRTHADRKRAISQLRRYGWNYFVTYLEAGELPRRIGQTNALQFGFATWVHPGAIHVD